MLLYSVYSIYLIPEDRVIYVGVTSRDPHKVFYEYTCNHDDFRELNEKYGYDAFRLDLLAEGLENETEAYNIKEYYTKFYSKNNNSLLNIAMGRNNMATHSKEYMQEHYKNTLAKWQAENGNWLKGKKMPEEMVRRMSEQRKGKPLPESTLKRLRENPPTAKPIYCVDTDVTYKSASEAGRVLGLDPSSILKCAKGKYTNTHGYHFGPPIPWSIKMEDNCTWDVKIE